MEKLHRLLTVWPDDEPSTVWICRASLLSTLEKFAPHVDQVTVNPFAQLQHQAPQDAAPIWNSVDHPVINQVREMRATAGTTGLLGCLDLRGEPRYFANRQASFEEIEWMVFAMVGANYQGLVWRHHDRERGNLPWEDQLARLESQLLAEAEGLGNATPVDWVQATGNTPVSALASSSRLYICILHRDYMELTSDSESFQMPLEHESVNTALVVRLPKGLRIDDIRTRAGLPVMLQAVDGEVPLQHRLRDGGTRLLAQRRGSSTESVAQEEVRP